MSRELMELVLPRLARRLDRTLRRYHAGQLDANQFSRRFESLLQQQHAWCLHSQREHRRARRRGVDLHDRRFTKRQLEL